MVTNKVPDHTGDELFAEFSEWFTNPQPIESTVSSD